MRRIPLKCTCGRVLRFRPAEAGRMGRCPGCGAPVRLEAPQHVDPDDEWYVRIQGEVRGPVTFAQLRKLAGRGRIDRDTEVRWRRAGAWMLAEDVRWGVRSREVASRSAVGSLTPDVFGRIRLALLGLLVVVALVIFLKRDDPTKVQEAAGVLTPQQIARDALPSVGVVRGRRGTGSGFLVAPGLFVTNYHVIAGELPHNLIVEFPNAIGRVEAFEPTLRFTDRRRDLAFLDVDAPLPPLRIADQHDFQPAEAVLVVGSPGLADGSVIPNAIAQGLISSRVELEGWPYYQLDMPVNPGNSGGPLIDMSGSVIGVVTAKARNTERLAFAVPHDVLLRGLGEATRQNERKIARVTARHRLDVAHRALLPAARLYLLAMVLYVRTLDPAQFASEELGVPQEDTLGSVLQKIDRRLISELRLEEDATRNDPGLTLTERDRFARLWTLYAELKSAVDSPQGSLGDYVALCRDLAERLHGMEASIAADE